MFPQDITREIEDKGYAVRPLLSEENIQYLLQGYDGVRQRVGDIGDLFWPSGRHPDPMIRNQVKACIDAVLPTALSRYVHWETVYQVGGTFLIKPVSENSALNPHQDSSHVDERTGYSVYAWIPLMDVNVETGCMHYFPGSHTWGIHQRSLNIPWVLEPVEESLWPDMVPIPMKAGEVLFFHSALVHSSPPNRGGETRVAINYYLHPKTHPFCHFYQGPETGNHHVEMYSVTPDFYYSEDFESRPDPAKYPLLETMPLSSGQYPDKVNQLLSKTT